MEHAPEDQKFKAFLETLKDLDDTPMEGGFEKQPINVNSAIELIERLSKSLEDTGELSRTELAEMQEKIKTLEGLQKIMNPVPQEVTNALVQLREVSRKSIEDFKEAA